MIKGSVRVELINPKTNKKELDITGYNFINPGWIKWSGFSNIIYSSANSYTTGNGIRGAGGIGVNNNSFGKITPNYINSSYLILSDNTQAVSLNSFILPGNVTGYVNGVYSTGNTPRGTILNTPPNTVNFGKRKKTTFRFTETQGGTGGNMTFQTIGFSPINIYSDTSTLLDLGYSILHTNSKPCRAKNYGEYFFIGDSSVDYAPDNKQIYLYKSSNNTITSVYTNPTQINEVDCDGVYIYIICYESGKYRTKKILISDYSLVSSVDNHAPNYYSYILTAGDYIYHYSQADYLIYQYDKNLNYISGKSVNTTTYPTLKYIGSDYNGYALDTRGRKFDIDRFMNGDGAIIFTEYTNPSTSDVRVLSGSTEQVSLKRAWSEAFINRDGWIYYGGTNLTTCIVLPLQVNKTSSQILDITYYFDISYPQYL